MSVLNEKYYLNRRRNTFTAATVLILILSITFFKINSDLSRVLDPQDIKILYAIDHLAYEKISSFPFSFAPLSNLSIKFIFSGSKSLIYLHLISAVALSLIVLTLFSLDKKSSSFFLLILHPTIILAFFMYSSAPIFSSIFLSFLAISLDNKFYKTKMIVHIAAILAYPLSLIFCAAEFFQNSKISSKAKMITLIILNISLASIIYFKTMSTPNNLLYAINHTFYSILNSTITLPSYLFRIEIQASLWAAPIIITCMLIAYLHDRLTALILILSYLLNIIFILFSPYITNTENYMGFTQIPFAYSISTSCYISIITWWALISFAKKYIPKHTENSFKIFILLLFFYYIPKMQTHLRQQEIDSSTSSDKLKTTFTIFNNMRTGQKTAVKFSENLKTNDLHDIAGINFLVYTEVLKNQAPELIPFLLEPSILPLDKRTYLCQTLSRLNCPEVVKESKTENFSTKVLKENGPFLFSNLNPIYYLNKKNKENRNDLLNTMSVLYILNPAITNKEEMLILLQKEK